MADIEAYYFPFLFICLIPSSTILVWAFLKSAQRSKSHIPPTPFALPIIGHLHLLSPIPHQAFSKLSSRYGPIFRLFLGSEPCIVVCSPEMAKEFLKTHEHVYVDRPLSSAEDIISYGNKGMSFAPYGPYWKFMKKIVMSKLLNGKTLDMLSSVRHQEINGFINSIAKNAKVGEAVNLGKELMKLNNNVISRMMMGEKCIEDKEENMIKLVHDLAVTVGNFNISDYIWLFKSLDMQGIRKKAKNFRARYDVMIERIIKEHEEARKHKEITAESRDLLHILLDIQHDETMEIELSRENIKAFILDNFNAATDTSAAAVEWGLSELINQPNIMKKVQEEINQVVGGNKLLQESDIPNLPYLQAIVKETLRLHPAVPLIPRQSTEDCMVAGYHIPAKTPIFINAWALGRDPNHWENPHEFRPERFQEKGNELDVRGQHFHILPFGSGKRMCPGVSLAQFMVHTTLGAMIQCFEWNAGKDGKLPSVDMEEGSGLTIAKANRLICVPVARLDPIPFPM
uniref:3,9-dihydroxypterocarpan 6A-monooxygenase-like n=1 Tax=Erigeron canadensis TaxID=72917 RepID=UPI001CB984D8|nr:3,9-dihydroxypterocarpan 6A-monooxygenase-like [Erigeron canadensis]